MIVSDRRLVVILDFNTRLLSGVRFVENGSSVSGFAYFNCLLSLARCKISVGYSRLYDDKVGEPTNNKLVHGKANQTRED